jgi:RNA-directed DNA polymerase
VCLRIDSAVVDSAIVDINAWAIAPTFLTDCLMVRCLGERVSASSNMSEISELKSATNLPHLARLLKLKGEYVSYALYWYRSKNPYSHFNIAKKSGGWRLISAPNSRLKVVQSRLASLLSNIEAEMEMRRTTKSRVLSHGFKTGFSIITNASHHRNRRWVFNVDLKDFFPSINFGRVYGFFIKDRNFQLDPKIATIIAQIACHDNKLPQGSPCSPVISNLITHILDLKLNKLANDLSCTYTRYADDLTFSTNEKAFPESIARLVRGSDDKWVAGDGLLHLVYRAGFKVNHEKTYAEAGLTARYHWPDCKPKAEYPP